jgi:holo-[acyl-carrier protein] synthase
MILGIGIDMIEIEEIRRSMSRFGERFAARFFTEGERAYCDARPNPAQHYAARFAAKEAFIKACGTAMPVECKFFRNIEVILDNGKPGYRFRGETNDSIFSNITTHLSMSHSETSAAAFAVMERTDLEAQR